MMMHNEFTVLHPECCGAPFAVPIVTYNRWRRDGTWWHCPHCGSRRHFTGPNEEQKRLAKLEQDLTRERQRREQAQERATEESRRYSRIRKRIQNGVCPDCNRTFNNLAKHMATKHSDKSVHQRARCLRYALGLSQADLCREIAVPSTKVSYISRFENDRPVPEWISERINHWMERQS